MKKKLAMKRGVDDTVLDFIRENPTLSTKALCRIFNYSRDQMNKIRDKALGDTRVKYQGRAGNEESLSIDDPLHEVATMIIEGMTVEERQRFDRWVEKKMNEKMEQMEFKRTRG